MTTRARFFRPSLIAGTLGIALLVTAVARLPVARGTQEEPPRVESMVFPLEEPGDPPGEPAPRPSGSGIPGDPTRPEGADPGPAPASAPIVRGDFAAVQVNVDANGNDIPGDAANEPSIAVDPVDPSRLAIGWRQFDTVSSNFRQAGYGYTADGGATWTFPGVLDAGVFRSDPVLASDAGGTFYYYSLTGDFTCDFFTSDDGGVTWSAPIEAQGGDKAWFTIDRTSGVGAGHVYIDWSLFAGCCGDDTFTRSKNGGQTFDPPMPSPEDIVWGTLAVGPDGELYVCGRAPSSSSTLYVARSATARDPLSPVGFERITRVDLGGSFAARTGPNPDGLLGQMWVAVDGSDGPRRGWVYVLASLDPPGGDPLDVLFSRSEDGGVSWSEPVRVNDDPAGNDAWQWFGTMSVAPDGRIDVVWNDTREDPSATFSELTYAWSYDGGLTWSTNEAVTPPFNHFLGYPNQNKLGDYYHGVSDAAAMHLAFAATFNGGQDVYYTRLGDADRNGVHDGRQLGIEGPDPGLVGTVNTITVSGATPGAAVRFVVGKQDGTTDVPGCTGLRFGMANARVARTRTAGADGTVSVSGFIGPAKSGKTFYFQALEPDSCNLSAVIVYTFP